MKIRAAKIEDNAGLATVQIESYCTTYAHIFPKNIWIISLTKNNLKIGVT